MCSAFDKACTFHKPRKNIQAVPLRAYLGQAGGGGNTLMAELGLEFEAQDFFDLAHGFPFGGHPRLRKKLGEDSPPWLKTSTNRAFIPFDRDRTFRIMTDDSGLSPKSVTIKRNPRSQSNGIVGHVRPEIAVTMVRNTHHSIKARN